MLIISPRKDISKGFEIDEVVGLENADRVVNGSSDEIELQAAIDEKAGVIRLKDSLSTDSTIDLDQPKVIIKGEVATHNGRHTTITPSGNFDALHIRTTSPGGLEDLCIDGANTTDADGVVIGTSSSSTKVKDTRMRNVVISGFSGGYGITGTGTPVSGSWDDTVFDNVRIRNNNIGLRNESTHSVYLGGSIAGSTVCDVEIPASSSSHFFGVVFTTSTANINVATSVSCGSYLFSGCYFESATAYILKRTVAPTGADTLGGFTFTNCNLKNLCGDNPMMDLTSMGCTVVLDNCSFEGTAGSNKTIKVGDNTRIDIRTSNITFPLIQEPENKILNNNAADYYYYLARKFSSDLFEYRDIIANVYRHAAKGGSKPKIWYNSVSTDNLTLYNDELLTESGVTNNIFNGSTNYVGLSYSSNENCTYIVKFNTDKITGVQGLVCQVSGDDCPIMRINTNTVEVLPSGGSAVVTSSAILVSTDYVFAMTRNASGDYILYSWDGTTFTNHGTGNDPSYTERTLRIGRESSSNHHDGTIYDAIITDGTMSAAGIEGICKSIL